MKKFLKKYEGGLLGKKVAVTGATGGIGEHLCRAVLCLGGSLIMLGRNEQKLITLKEKLAKETENSIEIIVADMENIGSCFVAAEQIKDLGADMLIHNAGAYQIPRRKTETGFNNVFTINFISPYVLTRVLMGRLERIVAVGSIAHNYSKTDEADIDFSFRRAASLCYGNAKRYLMFSHFELQGRSSTEIAVAHPGITLTNITAHFPKALYFFIKPLMKIIFMKPEKAAVNILTALFENTPKYSWFGPKIFDIWGGTVFRNLKTAKPAEIKKMAEKSEEIYKIVQNMQKNS